MQEEYEGGSGEAHVPKLDSTDEREEHAWEPVYDATQEVANYMADKVNPYVNTVLDALAEAEKPPEDRESVEGAEHAFRYVPELRERVDAHYEFLEETEVPYEGLEDNSLLDEEVKEAAAADIRETIGVVDEDAEEPQSEIAANYEAVVDRVNSYKERFDTAYEAMMEESEGKQEEPVAAPAT